MNVKNARRLHGVPAKPDGALSNEHSCSSTAVTMSTVTSATTMIMLTEAERTRTLRFKCARHFPFGSQYENIMLHTLDIYHAHPVHIQYQYTYNISTHTIQYTYNTVHIHSTHTISVHIQYQVVVYRTPSKKDPLFKKSSSGMARACRLMDKKRAETVCVCLVYTACLPSNCSQDIPQGCHLNRGQAESDHIALFSFVQIALRSNFQPIPTPVQPMAPPNFVRITSVY